MFQKGGKCAYRARRGKNRNARNSRPLRARNRPLRPERWFTAAHRPIARDARRKLTTREAPSGFVRLGAGAQGKRKVEARFGAVRAEAAERSAAPLILFLVALSWSGAIGAAAAARSFPPGEGPPFEAKSKNADSWRMVEAPHLWPLGANSRAAGNHRLCPSASSTGQCAGLEAGTNWEETKAEA